MMGVQTFWTDEETAELKRLAAQGLSDSKIAQCLSAQFRPISRNAVISKCDRIGVALGKQRSNLKAKPAASAPRAKPAKRKGGVPVFSARRARVEAKGLKSESAAPPAPLPAKEAQLGPHAAPRALVPLDRCQYIPGDAHAGALMCGAPARRDSRGEQVSPYCDFHHARCHAPGTKLAARAADGIARMAAARDGQGRAR
jgi:hypothetical protein